MRGYDVVVVGAGPGGAVAAEAAAAQGASVLLLDRKREVGIPVICGELTSHGTLREFDIDPDGPCIASVMDRIEMTFPGGRVLDFKGVRLATLYRGRFEKLLVERAVEGGAELRLRTMVTRVTERGARLKGGKEIPARIIIAADGVKSTVGKSVGMTRTPPRADLGRASKYMVESPDIEGDVARFFIGEEGVLGYAWVLPKRDGLANVGIGTLGDVRGDMRPLLDRSIDRLLPASRRRDYTGGCLPLSLPPQRTVFRNVMLVGDAAFMVNSVGGAGIRNAMVAGRIAGEMAGRCCAGGMPMSYLLGYEDRWRKKIYPRLRVNHVLKSMMWHSRRSVEWLYPVMAPLAELSNMAPGFLKWLQRRQHSG